MDKSKLTQLEETVSLINDLEKQIAALSDMDLQNKTSQFKQRLTKGESADDLLPEVFAVVREASKRTIGMRHYDTQLIGGILLHQRSIAEIGAGEGKTLVATLPVYLNVLMGKQVNVITLNDYLAQRDAAWMGDLYKFLGITVGVIVSGMETEQRREAYSADVIYGFYHELIFDSLKDFIANEVSAQVQGKLDFAIIDDADSILIDSASTPVAITLASQPGGEKLHLAMDKIVAQLSPQQTQGDKGDYIVDIENRQTYLTESGRQHVEKLMQDTGLLKPGENLNNADNKITLAHHLYAAMFAHHLCKRNDEYVVIDQQVKVIDKQTGKVRDDRYAWWLHEALEAKEKVPVNPKNKTLASITVQNYFGLYEGLAGMSGTASSEENEYQTVYDKEVNVVPEHIPTRREDLDDLVYLTEHEKFNAIVRDIEHCVSEGDPVLINCDSSAKSEYLANRLKQQNIQHIVIDDRLQPDLIVKTMLAAGTPRAVTILTNMAGWWADIPLVDESVATGGLYVIGTERHNVRRLDDQLASLTGRRGNPGWCRFYLSLEDKLMHYFTSEKTTKMMKMIGQQEDEAVEHALVSKAIQNAQLKVQEHEYKKRMNLLEYDDVVNEQRKLVYKQHDELVSVDDVFEKIKQLREEVLNSVIDKFTANNSSPEQWDITGLEKYLLDEFDLNLNFNERLDNYSILNKDILRQKIIDTWDVMYQDKEKAAGADVLRKVEKDVFLQLLDKLWQDYLVAVEMLRLDNRILEKITPISPELSAENTIWKMIPGKRAKAHVRDALQHERFIAFAQSVGEYFAQLQSNLGYSVITILSRIKIKYEDEAETTGGSENAGSNTNVGATTEKLSDTQKKIARNEMCPCGSGKRYKHCHGALNA